MQVASSENTNGIPFPELTKAKAVMCKVIPMFNVMHNHHLTIEDGMSLMDLAWRMSTNDMPESRPKAPPVFNAEPGQTIIQAIRQHFDERPFILNYEGAQLEITRVMTMTEAMQAGMSLVIDNKLSVKAKAAPKKPRKKAVKEPEAPAPVVEAQPEPQPQPKLTITRKTKQPAPAPVVEPDLDDEEEEDCKQPELATVEQGEGERLCAAVQRAWDKRPCRLLAGNHIIHITASMLLVDAQCEAAEIVGVDGNHDEPTIQPTFETLLDEEPKPQKQISASGLLFDNMDMPYQVARFDHPIPVDDSRWRVSHDRNSGADFVRTERAVWLDDYPYRISCVPFEDMMNTQTMFYVHCKERPTQQMFDVYHRLFREHTHKVHVRMTNDTQDGSTIITHEYCSWRPREGHNGMGNAGSIVSTVAEALGLNARWQPNAKYRIKYYDDNLQQVNHRYYLVKPNEQAVRLLDHRKMKAMMQTRPAGI
ncbi:hypothetical protein AH156_20105 [Salmonella enterica subsp. enterica serovar Enteritidis]|nr:hypothetical protein [Salmonella enterica subsp. enterica serovar Enteritidis]